MSKAILRAEHLKKSFGAVQAVRDVSLELLEGACLGLLGPNGAGKTTTIEMLEGILRPDSGRILFRDEPLGPLSRERCGIQFQHTSLPDYLTVREVLTLFSRLYPASVPLDELIRLCSLSEFLDRDTHELSGGQRQRVLLAVALVNQPELIFLDEPTTGLDPQARRNFWSLIRKIKQQGSTILLTTHYMEEAYELCDEVAIMDRGVIIAQGAPDALLKQHFQGVAIQMPREDFDRAQWRDETHRTALQPFAMEDQVEIQTGNLDETLRVLLDAGTPLSRIRIREQTLEDLFLSLTGKEIRA
jgi:ABC-2 type transport system ATP-binding protein